MSEEWRPVEGWPYEVSSLGRVRNVVARSPTRVGRILRGNVDAGGYHNVRLSDAPRDRIYKVHRLVAAAFVGPQPTPLHEVNHIDGDKKNNQATNLEWVTRSENIRHSFRLGLHTEIPRAPYSRLTREQLEHARQLVDERGASLVDAGRAIGVSAGYLCHLLNGERIPEGLEGITRTSRRPRKITQQQVDKARELRAAGNSLREVAAEVGVSAPHLCRILNGTAVPVGIR